jgi:hypothetical protein
MLLHIVCLVNEQATLALRGVNSGRGSPHPQLPITSHKVLVFLTMVISRHAISADRQGLLYITNNSSKVTTSFLKRE